MRYLERVRSTFSGKDFPTFTIDDLRLSLKGTGISDAYIYVMLHNLLKNGEVTRITRGIYTFHDDAVVAGFAFRPFYYGLESALSIRGVSGQGANYIIMTPRNVRTGMRSFHGRNYRVQRVESGLMFGYSVVRYGSFWVPVSDVEKTVIDMLYFDGAIRDELWPGIAAALDRKRLMDYLKRYPPYFRKRALDSVAAMGRAGRKA